METVKTEFTDNGGAGNVTLYENPFANGVRYYARFDRNTVNGGNLISRIQKREAGTNAFELEKAAAFFKTEILDALARGEAVNVFDLGTLYIAPKPKSAKKTSASKAITGGNAITASTGMDFIVKFTASEQAKKAVSGLKVRRVVMATNTPSIESVENLLDGSKNTVTPGVYVRLTGSKLKFGGNTCGIFFVPCNADGSMDADEEKWIAADAAYLPHNSGKRLEFRAPKTLEDGGRFYIAVRTSLSSSGFKRKDAETGFTSFAVTVKGE